MTKFWTVLLALFLLTAPGCMICKGHPTPYGTMGLREWEYVQTLSPEQQAITGPIYAEEFKTMVLVHE